VIEVLSPSTESNDRGNKFQTYQKYGVREYWLVNPEARFVEVYRHEAGKFERQGVFKPEQPFVSAVLGGATIHPQPWFGEPS
jgi:Uma2 family endonuclease